MMDTLIKFGKFSARVYASGLMFMGSEYLSSRNKSLSRDTTSELERGFKAYAGPKAEQMLKGIRKPK